MSELEYKIANPLRKLRVISVQDKEINVQDRISKKLILTTKDELNGYTFVISDVWLQAPDEAPKIQGLWINEILDAEGVRSIAPHSTIAKVLEYYKINKSLKELEGTEVFAYPDSKNFLVLVACDVNEIKSKD